MTVSFTLPTWHARLQLDALSGQAAKPVDPSNAVQFGPLVVHHPEGGIEIATFGPERSSAALFEGYIFDRDQLKMLLDSPFAEPTEAQLVTLAYERWGKGLFDHLEGAYLIAIWDASQRRFIVGHDGLGKHPLYYVQQDKEFLFASNIFELANHPHVSRAPNRISLGLRILGRWPQAGETFFAEIKRVRPGHYLEIDAKGHSSELQFWEPFPEEVEPWLPDEDIYEQFETMFTKSVARCMQLEPKGIFLSGGIDSVSVAAVAAKYVEANDLDPLIAYSGQSPPDFPGSYEEEFQNQVVQRLGMPHRTSNAEDWLDGRDLLSATLDEVPHMPGPTDVWWTGAYMGFYRRAASEGVSTILSGSGGDEWLGLHAMYYADLMRKRAFPLMMKFLEAQLGKGNVTAKTISRTLWQYGVRLRLLGIMERVTPRLKINLLLRKRRRSLPKWLCPDTQLAEDILHVLITDGQIPALSKSGKLPSSHYRHAFRAQWKNPLIAYEAERGFHVNALVGIKRISPFHDRALSSFSGRISPGALLRGKQIKGLLRPLATRYLPGLGLEDQRKTYSPVDETFSGRSLRQYLKGAWRRAGNEIVSTLGLVDREQYSEAINQTEGLHFRDLAKLYTALTVETWLNANA